VVALEDMELRPPGELLRMVLLEVQVALLSVGTGLLKVPKVDMVLPLMLLVVTGLNRKDRTVNTLTKPLVPVD
jgi:hypothetical protein